MATTRYHGLSLTDRRWIALASGLLALWMQFIAPMAMPGLMQPRLKGFDTYAVLCQPQASTTGKTSPSDHGKIKADCQICVTLQQLAASATPAEIFPVVLPQPAGAPVTGTFWVAPTLLAQASFSSRAPPQA
jgi:hypothetical protein